MGRRIVMAIVAWAAIATVVVADEVKKPVCALVDASQHPATTILEARLLEDKQATWVERTQIERVLREQTLKAAFGAGNVRERSSIGRLLKADVLILLRTVPGPAGGATIIECSVSETERGLRLATASLSDEKDAQAVADALYEAVQRGLAKQREKIMSLVAVPPFLSDDLGYEYNHLQFAYARLAEQRLLDQPGWLAIEVQEAQALAKELALTAPGAETSKRDLPLFLLGRYRHDGRGEKQTLTMSLRLLRDEQQLAIKGTKTLTPATASDWIHEQTAACVAAVSDKPLAAAPSAKDEAHQLAARAALFERIGNWEEAAALLEASWLVKPQPETHRRAIIAYGYLTRKNFKYEAKRLEEAAACWNYYQRGMEHVEAFFQDAGPLKQYAQAGQTDFLAQFDHSVNAFSVHPKMATEVLERMEEVRQIRSGTYLRLARLRRKQGFPASDELPFAARSLQTLPEIRQMAILLELAGEYKDLADGQQRIVTLAMRGYQFPRDTPEFRDFIDQLARLDTAAARGAREELMNKLEAGKVKQPNPIEVAPFVADLKLEPVTFTNDAGEKKIDLIGGIRAAEGLDVFWTQHNVYFMKKPGELQRALPLPDRNTHVSSLVYDGRYVWVAAARIWHSPLIAAIDPATGKHWRFTAEDGLPYLPEGKLDMASGDFAKLAPIGPGKVCLVGITGRTWLATLTVSVDERKTARIFHEARQAANPEDVEQAKAADVMFRPNAMLSVYEGRPYESDCRILIARDTHNLHAASRPLIVDPQRETVTAASYYVWGQGDSQTLAAQANAVYVRQPEKNNKHFVRRAAFPLDKLEVVTQDAPDGWLCPAGDDLFVVGKQWAKVNVSTGAVTTIAKQTPWYPIYHPLEGDQSRLWAVIPSYHYGTLVFLTGPAKGMQHFRLPK
jgi:hypothetical protein